MNIIYQYIYKFIINVIIMVCLCFSYMTNTEASSKESSHSEYIEYYTNIIKNSPQNIDGYIGLATLYLNKNEYDNAEHIIRVAIQNIPNNSDLYSKHSYLLFRKGALEEALEQINKALYNCPQNADYYRRSALILFESGRIEDSDYAATKAIELSPNDWKNYMVRGYVNALSTDNKRLISDLDKAIELYSNESVAYFLRGLTYARTGHYRKALKDLDKAIEMDPEVSLYRYMRIYTFFMLGKMEDSKEDYKIINKSNWGKEYLYMLEAYINICKGDIIEAEKQIDLSINMILKNQNIDTPLRKLSLDCVLGIAIYYKGMVLMSQELDGPASNVFLVAQKHTLYDNMKKSVNEAIEYYKKYDTAVKGAVTESEKTNLIQEKRKFEKVFLKNVPPPIIINEFNF